MLGSCKNCFRSSVDLAKVSQNCFFWTLWSFELHFWRQSCRNVSFSCLSSSLRKSCTTCTVKEQPAHQNRIVSQCFSYTTRRRSKLHNKATSAMCRCHECGTDKIKECIAAGHEKVRSLVFILGELLLWRWMTDDSVVARKECGSPLLSYAQETDTLLGSVKFTVAKSWGWLRCPECNASAWVGGCCSVRHIWALEEGQLNGMPTKSRMVDCLNNFLFSAKHFLSVFLSFSQSRNTLARHLAPDLLGATTCLELKIEILFAVTYLVGLARRLPLDTHHVSTRDWILRQDMRLSGMPLAAEWFWWFFRHFRKLVGSMLFHSAPLWINVWKTSICKHALKSWASSGEGFLLLECNVYPQSCSLALFIGTHSEHQETLEGQISATFVECGAWRSEPTAILQSERR